jgi:hypothetical protein
MSNSDTVANTKKRKKFFQALEKHETAKTRHTRKERV